MAALGGVAGIARHCTTSWGTNLRNNLVLGRQGTLVPLSPVLREEGQVSERFTPHPRPLSPEYRGEGRKDYALRGAGRNAKGQSEWVQRNKTFRIGSAMRKVLFLCLIGRS